MTGIEIASVIIVSILAVVVITLIVLQSVWLYYRKKYIAELKRFGQTGAARIQQSQTLIMSFEDSFLLAVNEVENVELSRQLRAEIESFVTLAEKAALDIAKLPQDRLEVEADFKSFKNRSIRQYKEAAQSLVVDFERILADKTYFLHKDLDCRKQTMKERLTLALGERPDMQDVHSKLNAAIDTFCYKI